MAGPYRGSERAPRTYRTPRVGAFGWPWALAGILALALAMLGVVRIGDVITLECPSGRESVCKVMRPRSYPLILGGDVVADIQYLRRTNGHVDDDSFSVRVIRRDIPIGKNEVVRLRTRANCDSFLGALEDHRVNGSSCDRVFDVGGSPLFIVVTGGVGLLLLGLFMFRRGSYLFVRDDKKGTIRIERASGSVAPSVVELPIGDVAEIVAMSHEPDKAFTRYAVVLRTRAGDELHAFPTELSSRDAFRIANAASELLDEESM